MIGEGIKNIITGILCILALVNLCKTGDVRNTVYSAEDNLMKVVSPVADRYIDSEYVGNNLKKYTGKLMENEFVNMTIDEFEKSGASDELAKIFAPMIERYGDVDVSGLMKEYGLNFDLNGGQYAPTDVVNQGDDLNKSDEYGEDALVRPVSSDEILQSIMAN